MGDVRWPWLLPALAGMAGLVFARLLYLTSYKNFFYDEWDWVTQDRPWDLKLLLLPHNEHWSTIPLLVWKVLFVSVGIRSHIPYQAAVLVVHVIAVLLLFALVRRRSGELPAFAAALTLRPPSARRWSSRLAAIGHGMAGRIGQPYARHRLRPVLLRP